MTQELYDNLWHYSELFSRDPLQRSELVTMAYVQGKRMGDRCTPGLMKSVMHYRSKELNRRSAFPAKEMGKRTLDAWNRPERVYLDKPRGKDDAHTIGDVVLNTTTTPLDYAITQDFLQSLSAKESALLGDLAAGYKQNEICKRQHITYLQFQSFRKSVQEKAVEYL
jgi:hypothetical protein